MPDTPTLSKSRMVIGQQCTLRLYRDVHEPAERPAPDTVLQARFDRAHQVEEVARSCYPDGVLITWDHRHHSEAVTATAAAMADPDVPAVFEAAFIHQGVRIRADVLLRTPDGRWDLEEVKATTRVKDVQRYDTATQVWVLRGAGVALRKVRVAHLAKGYRREPDGLDPRALMRRTDVRTFANEVQAHIGAAVAALREMLAQDEPPHVATGGHCSRPYPCPYVDRCGPTPAPSSLSVLPESGKLRQRLAAQGITELDQLPADVKLNPLQRRIADCHLHDREHVGSGLRAALDDVRWPLHFMDFETFSPAVPRYPGAGPFQALATQWSLHTLAADGTLSHAEFLHDADTDPSEAFVSTLLSAAGTAGTVVVYSPYEKRILGSLAERLPWQAEPLQALIARFQDQFELVKTHFYSPAFGGSFSVKAVMPALVSSLSYDGLPVGDGQAADAAYGRMIDPATDPADAARLRQELLAYCCQDTLAMVGIRTALLTRCP